MPYFLLKLFKKNTLEDDYHYLIDRINEEYHSFKRVITLAHSIQKYHYKRDVLLPEFESLKERLNSSDSISEQVEIMQTFLGKLIKINKDPF